MGLFSGVHTGDIIIFSDKYWITSHMTRLATLSRWTHVAIIIDLTLDENDILIWEVSNNIFPLEDRISGTRKCRGTRLVSLRERMKTFPKLGNKVIIMTLNNDQISRDCMSSYVHPRILPLLMQMSQIEFRSSPLVFLKAALSHDLRLFRRLRLFQHRTFSGQYLKKNLFCSEALVVIYQELGILSIHFNPKRSVPADFYSGLLPFVGGWRLEPFLSLSLKSF